MYKGVLFKKVKFALVLIIAFSIVSFNFAYAVEKEGFRVMGQQVGVDLDKSWTVTFSKDFDKATVGQSSVKIEDEESGKIISTEILFYSDSGKAFRVKPKENYEQGKKYKLTVQNIKAPGDAKAAQPTMIEFSTKTLTSTTATAKVEAGSIFSWPLMKKFKRITVLSTTLSNVAYVQVGQEGEVKKIGETIGVTLPDENTKTVEVYLYTADLIYIGKGTVTVGDSGDKRIFNISTQSSGNETGGE